MNSFEHLNLSKQLLNALNDLGLSKPTPIQTESVNPLGANQRYGQWYNYLLRRAGLPQPGIVGGTRERTQYTPAELQALVGGEGGGPSDWEQFLG